MFTITSVLRDGRSWSERVNENDYLETVQDYINWYFKSGIKSFEVNGRNLSETEMFALQDAYEEKQGA